MKKKIYILSGLMLFALLTAACIYYFGFYLPEKQQKADRIRQAEAYYADKLALYQTENDQYDDYEVDVAFLGDSLTDGYDLDRYYPQFTVANRGIGGETTFGLSERLQVSLYDLKPKIAVILIGGNNLDTMLENYEDMLVQIKNTLPRTKLVLCSLTAMGRELAPKNPLAAYNNVVIEKLAHKHDLTFVDLYAPLLDETIGEIRADYTTDGAHLTNAGYSVLTNALTPVLEKLLADTAS